MKVLDKADDSLQQSFTKSISCTNYGLFSTLNDSVDFKKSMINYYKFIAAGLKFDKPTWFFHIIKF